MKKLNVHAIVRTIELSIISLALIGYGIYVLIKGDLPDTKPGAYIVLGICCLVIASIFVAFAIAYAKDINDPDKEYGSL